MTIGEVFSYLDSIAPFDTALEYDNPGLLVGDPCLEVTGITVALDCYNKTISEALENGSNLIVTHHPVIFDPLKAVREGDIVFSLIKNGISLISAHTNLDMVVGGVNDMLCKKIGLENIKYHNKVFDNTFEFRSGELPSPLCTDDFAAALSKALNVRVKYCGSENLIKTVAVCSGSGGGLLDDVVSLGVDAFITADCKHSAFVEADRAGISLYDCGHFNTEDVIVEPLAEKLRTNCPGISVHTSHFSNIKYMG